MLRMNSRVKGYEPQASRFKKPGRLWAAVLLFTYIITMMITTAALAETAPEPTEVPPMTVEEATAVVPQLKWRLRKVACANDHTVWIRDGKVYVAGNEEKGYTGADTEDWTDIAAVCCSETFVAGLKADGHVVIAGESANVMRGCEQIDSVLYITSMYESLVCVTADKKAYVFGSAKDGMLAMESELEGVIAAAGSMNAEAFLYENGTVIVNSELEGLDLSAAEQWTDIIDIAMGPKYMIGLKGNGTVVIAGEADEELLGVKEWNGVMAIAAGGKFALGLRTDGTVYACGENLQGQCDTGDWTDVVSIAAGYDHACAAMSDGTVIAIGYNGDGQCETR